jgi:lambda family phage tail tape measure protein
MAGDLNYNVGIDTSAAERSLQGLKNTLLGLGGAIAGAFAVRELVTVSSKFEDLRLTLQSLYRSAGQGSAVFNDIKEFAKSSAFAVDDLVQTVIKLKTAGLEPNIALLRLFADVSGSVADKLGALQAITDLYARTTAGGLGLEDLNRLADRGIPVFTILQEKLGLSRLEVSKIGQSAEGATLILKALESGLAETFGGAAASKANSLGQAMSNFKDVVNNAIDSLGRFGLNTALAKFINSLGDALQRLEPFIAIIGIQLAKAFEFLAENIKIVLALAAAFTTVLAVGTLVSIARGVMLLVTAFGVLAKSPVLIALQVLAGAFAATLGVLGLQKEKVDEAAGAYDRFKEALDQANQAGLGLKPGNLSVLPDDALKQVDSLNAALQKAKAEIENTIQAYQRQNGELIKRLKFEQELIGVSDQQKTAKQALFDLESNYLNEVNKLLDDYRVKSQSKASEDQKQLPMIRDAIQRVTESYSQQIKAVENLTNQNYLLAEAEKQRLAFAEFSIKGQLDNSKELTKLQDDMAKLTMSEIEKKYYDIGVAAKESARSAIESENSRRRSLKITEMSTEEERRYYDQATKGNEALKQQTGALYEQSRQFGTGWTNALNSFLENTTNAADAAKNIFGNMTKGLEDSFVKFVQTGKLSFKDLVNSIIADIARSQIRSLLSNLISGPGAAATDSLGNMFKNLLGFANGGMIPTNRPVLVGERGPEILSGVGGRTVIPNNQLGGNSQYVTYNISAVDAMSFKAMIARDPSFIHAVAQQGAAGIPNRR